MTAYRDRRPPGDETFFYGPFEGRLALAFIFLCALAMTTFVAVHTERAMLRSVTCSEEGRCVVVRGGAFFGPRIDQVFPAQAIAAARIERRHSKSRSYDVLVLVPRTGRGTYEIDEGTRPTGDLKRLQAYFADGAEGAIEISRPTDAMHSLMLFALALVPLGLLVAQAVAEVRARVRFRVSVLTSEGLLRIERVVMGKPQEARDIPLSDIEGVELVGAGGYPVGAGSALPVRVMVKRRLSPDEPICPTLQRGAAQHQTLVEELRRCLAHGAPGQAPAVPPSFRS